MNKNRRQSMNIEDLVAQDAEVRSFNFEEFRMKLESSIQDLERYARIVNRALWWTFGVFLTCALLVVPLEASGIFDRYGWLRLVWLGVGQVALLVTIVLAVIYSYRYRPALKRAKNDLQSAMIAQLQQQVAELSRKLDSQ